MNELLKFVLDKHGGADRWNDAKEMTAHIYIHGGFWAAKGQPDLLSVETVTADVRRQRISMTPFGEGHRLDFDMAADRVTIFKADDGTVADSLDAPRHSMAGYARDTKWSSTQTGYFISYATWLYVMEPHLFTMPGVVTQEIDPWNEEGEVWRRLQVTFPDTIAPHSRVQTYYFDSDTGLQRRLDYCVNVNGDAPVAQYTSEHKDFNGLIVPTRRRVLLRRPDNTAIREHASILLDVTDVALA